MSPHLARILLGCGVFLSSGCGSDPGAFGRCDPLTSVTVVTSPVVEFSWEPADCDASTLSVDYQGATQWHLFTEGGNGLSSPIRYGLVPDGASASGAELLLQGRRYTLVSSNTPSCTADSCVLQACPSWTTPQEYSVPVSSYSAPSSRNQVAGVSGECSGSRTSR